jgi:hypothetical protein
LHRGHCLCSVEIFHTPIGRCFQLILIRMRPFCLCLLHGDHISDFLHFLFRTFSSFLGGMGASIVLLKEQDSFSCVFTTYSFIFIRIRHMIGKIWKKWQTVLKFLSMAEKAVHWSKNIVYSVNNDTSFYSHKVPFGFCLVWFMVFNTTFNNISIYIVVVSFIGGGNWSTRRKPLTCRKSLTNFIT